MINSTPLVSIILPVYNCEEYVGEAIQSILDQTLVNFELIVANDGSTDGSLAIIKSFSDSRIILVDQANMGLPKTLNKMISMCKGQFIARQDADDISLPQRLEKQIQFFLDKPRLGMLGSWSKIMVDRELTERMHRHPYKNKDMRLFLYFDSPFVHTSVVFRREVFESVGNYSYLVEKQPEDYELWLRIAQKYEIANLPEVLVYYREVQTSICRIVADPFPFLPQISAKYLSARTFNILPEAFTRVVFSLYRSKSVGRSGKLYCLLCVCVSAIAISLSEKYINIQFIKQIKRIIRKVYFEM